MSGISLTQTVSRGTDVSVDVQSIGINYDASRVLVRLEYSPSGTTRDFTFEGAALTNLRNGVQQFSGLRVALLQYIQGLAADLGGNIT